jgi:hypothetical protein
LTFSSSIIACFWDRRHRRLLVGESGAVRACYPSSGDGGSSGWTVTVAGQFGYEGIKDGMGQRARFDCIRAITCDGADNIFVADTHTIRRIHQLTYVFVTHLQSVTYLLDHVPQPLLLLIASYLPAGDVTTFGMGSEGSLTYTHNPPEHAWQPTSLCLDGDGFIYTIDTGHVIRKLSLANGNPIGIPTIAPIIDMLHHQLPPEARQGMYFTSPRYTSDYI